MKNSKILIVGASGTVGSEIVRILKSSGHQVRVTTSKNVQPTDEVVHVNLATGEGIKNAMEGIERAFFLSPPGYADQHAMLSPLIQEAKRKGLKKVVLMTALGANAVDTTPFRKAEIELEKSGLTYNIIRPNWFFQNFNTFWVQGIREIKKILLPVGTAKTGFIDARDVAAVAAKLLVSDELSNQAFDLTGPESLDHDQIASGISEAVGAKVVYEEIEPDVLRQGFLKGGVPADYTEFLLAILGFLKAGYNDVVNDNVQKITGHAPSGLSKYVSDYKQQLI